MTNTPLVTIVTPVLNAKATIERTILSVLQQTYKNFEYIVIDGGSTDGTLDILNLYTRKFAGKMKIISERDNGIYFAINKGLAMANGEIIGVLNSDDWYEADTLQIIIKNYLKDPRSIIYGLVCIWENGKRHMIMTVSVDYLHVNMIPHPTVFVPKSVYQLHGVFDTEFFYAADLELLLRFRERKVKFCMVLSVLANFSVGGVTTQKKFESIAESHKILYKYGYLTQHQYFKLRLKENIKKRIGYFFH